MNKRTHYVRKFHLKKHSLIEPMSAKDIAHHVNVSLATAHRWVRENKIPAHYRELLEFKALGLVPDMPGLFVRNGELHTPTGYTVNQVELEQFAWNMTNFSRIVRENDRLRDEVRRLRHWLEQRQPEPVKPQHQQKTKIYLQKRLHY